jgi:hypothetical protein
MEYREAKESPEHWQDFENLCLKPWRPRDIDAKKHCLRGPPQAGVDIFGRDPKTGGRVGIQCKQREQCSQLALTIPKIENEIRRAESIEQLGRGLAAQEQVRQLGEQRCALGHFTVDLFSSSGHNSPRGRMAPSLPSWRSLGPAGVGLTARQKRSAIPRSPCSELTRVSNAITVSRVKAP